ncbi:esiB [Symbiodinium necroappetens]|uniref:EsiB protein n=1 Tax=Symbiodinium necroappetens TaxID=1628268 RepID=A0A812W6R9_9DINO|nr:esiB [Symbiodinium necroappetens]
MGDAACLQPTALHISANPAQLDGFRWRAETHGSVPGRPPALGHGRGCGRCGLSSRLVVATLFGLWSRRRPCVTTMLLAKKKGFAPEEPKEVEVLDTVVVEGKNASDSSEDAVLPEVFTEDMRDLRQAAEDGDRDAQFRYGKALLKGWEGQEANQASAAEWLLRAAEGGQRAAQSALGEMYYTGLGRPQNKELALEWYMKAAKSGDMDGQYHVGEMYHEGEGVKVSKRRAGRWFLKAAEQGRKEAQYNVAMMFHFGNGLAADREAASQWYRKAAEQGLMEAQYSLGVMLERGEGIEVDKAESAKWYQKAAEAGHIAAQNNLGAAYYLGEGVEENKATAAMWFEKAAREGTQLLLPPLLAATEYTLRVCSTNCVGDSEGAVLLLKTKPGTPAAPKPPRSRWPAGAGPLRLSWRAPEDGGSPVVEYEVLVAACHNESEILAALHVQHTEVKIAGWLQGRF